MTVPPLSRRCVKTPYFFAAFCIQYNVAFQPFLRKVHLKRICWFHLILLQRTLRIQIYQTDVVGPDI